MNSIDQLYRKVEENKNNKLLLQQQEWSNI